MTIMKRRIGIAPLTPTEETTELLTEEGALRIQTRSGQGGDEETPQIQNDIVNNAMTAAAKTLHPKANMRGAMRWRPESQTIAKWCTVQQWQCEACNEQHANDNPQMVYVVDTGQMCYVCPHATERKANARKKPDEETRKHADFCAQVRTRHTYWKPPARVQRRGGPHQLPGNVR
eukprot:COSAG02_NODE_1328_length_13219_cov_45.612652_9_plen_175_part_00